MLRSASGVTSTMHLPVSPASNASVDRFVCTPLAARSSRKKRPVSSSATLHEYQAWPPSWATAVMVLAAEPPPQGRARTPSSPASRAWWRSSSIRVMRPLSTRSSASFASGISNSRSTRALPTP